MGSPGRDDWTQVTAGKLVFIPTPLDESLPLESVAKEILFRDCLRSDVLLLVEEHKVARQRWLKWGLPREAIERFDLFNEHIQNEACRGIVADLIRGKTAYLMSDGGLPAFCDPGKNLVNECHQKGIRVTSTPFPNSIALAVALSGFDHSRFTFAGFLSTNPDERKKELDQLAGRNETMVVMDTPYRLKALLTDIGTSKLKGRKFFLATNLNSSNEKSICGGFSEVAKAAELMQKPEFVLVISAP